MANLDDLLKQRAELAAQLSTVDAEITEVTGLPDEWNIDPSGGPMAGGVALYGPNCDRDRDREDFVTISVSTGAQYGSVFMIVDHGRETRSPWVDPEAVRAALKIYDQRNAERERKRQERRNR